MTPTHDHFTLLYEDGDTKVLHEFKEVVADQVIEHLVNFLKGCGYFEHNIYECMKETAEMYFDSLSTQQYVMNWDKLDSE